jgi:gliding motility-associated lipoprotein gldH
MRRISLLLLLIVLVGCNKQLEYAQYVSLPNGWVEHQSIPFYLDENDTLTPKNLFIMLRNDEQYEFSNIFLITKMEVPHSNKVIIDTLEYEMANAEGQWLGDGFSAVKESKLWYKENFLFPAKGKYVVKIEQAMRKIGTNQGIEVLKGITEVGLRVENPQLNK